MWGKPIDQLTAEDIHQLIADEVSEGPTLEFKRDIPVHPQHRRQGAVKDQGWIPGRPIADHGRDELAAEIVAFAHATGGTVILGIEDSNGNPATASGINALPDVTGLERRLKDAFNSCIEPRLPYLAVRGIRTEDDGSGVVVIETSPSMAGPHWVRKTRAVTIRREDRCDPVSMTELHDMVLRRSRSLEAAERRTEVERAAFPKVFFDRLTRLIDNEHDSFVGDAGSRIATWLRLRGKASFGVNIVLTPHFELGIPRLESLHELYPDMDAIQLINDGNYVGTGWLSRWNPGDAFVQRILGGMSATSMTEQRTHIVKVMRDGRIGVTFIHVRHDAECTLFASDLAAGLGVAVGVFDRLRERSTYPAAPANLTIDIRSLGRVGVGVYEEAGSMMQYGSVASEVAFPSYTIGDVQDFSVLFHEVLGDLMNMVNKRAADLQPIKWIDLR